MKIENGKLVFSSPSALGIAAASFWSVAEKDRAESPTAIAGTPKRKLKIES
jgi:hypothetical protein